MFSAPGLLSAKPPPSPLESMLIPGVLFVYEISRKPQGTTLENGICWVVSMLSVRLDSLKAHTP